MITVSNVDEVLRSEDLETLFQHGAPSDEYAHETRAIVEEVARLNPESLSDEQLTEIVLRVWTRSFGPFSAQELEMRMPDFRQVAHRILNPVAAE